MKKILIYTKNHSSSLGILDIISIIKKNLSLNKIKEASECVHKIKHKIAVYGMENSFYIAQEYENNLREGKIELQKEFEETLIVIRDFTNLL